MQKCVICDETHEEYLHHDEFAVEQTDKNTEEVEKSEEIEKKTEEVEESAHPKMKSSVQGKVEKYTAGKAAKHCMLPSSDPTSTTTTFKS